MTIPPLEQKIIDYKIKIPKRNYFKGTYWSMIMVEQFVKKIDKIQDISVNDLIDFKQKIRYGIQVITNFQDKGDLQLKFKRPIFNKIKTNKYLFKVDLQNIDIYEIKAEVKIIIINNETGKIVQEINKKPIRIYPNTSIRVKNNIELDGGNKYKILVVVGNKNRGYIGKRFLVEVKKD